MKSGPSRLKKLHKCLKVKHSQGFDPDDAEMICRRVDGIILNVPDLPLESPSGESNSYAPAASPGPGWLSRGTSLGTDAVVKADPLTVANDWVRAQKRKITRADWTAWREHARRMGLDPTAMDQGWRVIGGPRREGEMPESVFDELHSVFAEVVSPGTAGSNRQAYGGYYVTFDPRVVPKKRRVSPEPEQGPEDMQVRERKKTKKALGERVGVAGGSSGPGVISPEIKTYQAPTVGNARGQADLANQNPGFGWRTWSARMVYEMAMRLIPLYPEKNAAEILGMAIRKSGVLTSELTPEDDRMLKMAIDWAQSGPARTNIRTGGTPGGPFRSTADGHFGNPRGTFAIT